MQDIRLSEMRVRNFKGIRELDIYFDRKDINIFGENGTGKTSIIDSFTWLLFGKDSLGRADFGIKPTDKNGDIIHQLETSVEAVFDISGMEKAFKKTLTEVWTRKRGAVEAEFTGNESSYYIDGVPKKKAEYTAAIKSLIDESVFKIITNPLYFNESVNWKDRRSVLLAICGEVSDAEVIAANDDLAPLLPLLQGKSVSDFKDITASTMKRINKELDMIPVKINEAELAKPSAADLEIDLARKDALTQEIEGLRIKKANINNGTEVIQHRQDLSMLRREFEAVGKGFFLENTPEGKRAAAIRSEIANLKIAINQAAAQKGLLISEIEQRKTKRVKISGIWDKVFADRFTDSVCPTCHRELPEDEVEARRSEFNMNKAKQLDDIESENAKLAAEIIDLEAAFNVEDENLDLLQSKMSGLQTELDGLVEAIEGIAKAQEEKNRQERGRIGDEIAEVEKLIRDYADNTSAAVAEVERQIVSLSTELSVIDTAIANKALLERQDKRIAELRAQQKQLAIEYTTSERHLFLAEQFIVAKVNMLNERINQKFKHAKFKLFDKQINGGINEVCEVTYDGIPYKDLNNAMKINIGLDVINTIAAYYGVTAPIMIDNAESVNEIFHTDAQQIRFYVSRDKQLNFKED